MEKMKLLVGNIMEKVISDVGHGLIVALACCIISTKNSLKPSLLVFEGVTSRKLITSHLNVMHSARKRFTKMNQTKSYLEY